jgi:hypothetical protein
MTPGPTLEELLAIVRTDAGSEDPLAQLTTASQTVAELEEVADATLAHFVDQCRRAGRSWSEISKALGVTKQAAHKRFSPPALLDRLTARARAVVPFATGEAKRLGHNYVGTEHLLLGLYVDAECLAAKVLVEAGITKAVVEADVVALTPRGTATTDDPPLTPRATECLEHSISEAVALGHNYVGTEHILLALFANEEGFAARIMTQHGATHETLTARIIEKLSGYVARGA